MSSVLDSSLELATQRVRFFQVIPNAKTPAVDKFSERATSDSEKIREMFDHKNFNSGIACGKVSEDLYLVGLDIDFKDGRDGYKTISDFDAIGLEFPDTWTQKTPSGGMHMLYWSPVPIKQGTDVLGVGVDTRGDGGYLVGPGSSINGGYYVETKRLPIAKAPQWMIEKYERKATILQLHKGQNAVPLVQDQVLALKRSVEFLQSLPPAKQGTRNHEAYKAACRLKDFGLSLDQMPDILGQYFNAEPPLEDGEITAIAASAFKSGQNLPGIASPEMIFDVLPVEPKKKDDGKDYIELFNDNFFYCATNGTSMVCEEMLVDGKPELQKYSVPTFHEKFLSRTTLVASGDDPTARAKLIQHTKEWMKNKRRRSYDAIRFIPKPDVDRNIYNTWRGFAVKPAPTDKIYSPEAKKGFENFVLHARENICSGNESDFEWLMDFVAHMFQRPWERPTVALVFQGLKGTGKNIFSDCLGNMIGPKHYVVIPDRHQFTTNFNSIMESKILITLDEAFWVEDKAKEGILKSLITSNTRKIEFKGEEPYTTPVFDRIIILGNEEKLVNATGDERRYAVFNIGDGKRGNTKFFGELLSGMHKHGGNELLMRYLLDRDISNFNCNLAPETEGLQDQKEHALSNFENWWKECLSEGYLVGNTQALMSWPERVIKNELFTAYAQYLKTNGIGEYRVQNSVLGKKFKRVAPSCSDTMRGRQGEERFWEFKFCSLDQARIEWNKAMKMKTKWE